MGKIKRVSLFFRAVFQITFSISLSTAWASESTQTTLPLEFNTGNPAPYGMASTVISIEGKSFPIILDTGAKKYGLILTKEALKKIHVHFTGKVICSNSVTGKHCEREFIVPEVKLGSFTVKNVEGILVKHFWGGDDQDFKVTEASRNGLLGYALLSKFNLLLDYKNSKLTLVKPANIPTQYDVTKWNAIPFDDHLHTKLNADGKQLTFSWDTGALPSIISRKTAAFFKQVHCPKDNPFKEPMDTCFRVVISSLTTGDEFISNNSWFSVTDIPDNAPFDGLIGSNFYMDNLVYFDFDHRKIYVNKINDSTGIDG